jgi:hypothetical protein
MENSYEVPKRQWNKWSDEQRLLFEDMMDWLSDKSFIDPLNHTSIDVDQWETIRWNCAFLAAASVGQ